MTQVLIGFDCDSVGISPENLHHQQFSCWQFAPYSKFPILTQLSSQIHPIVTIKPNHQDFKIFKLFSLGRTTTDCNLVSLAKRDLLQESIVLSYSQDYQDKLQVPPCHALHPLCY